MMTDLRERVAYTAKKFIDKISKGKANFNHSEAARFGG